MKVITKSIPCYIASDGREFDHRNDCIHWEHKLTLTAVIMTRDMNHSHRRKLFSTIELAKEYYKGNPQVVYDTIYIDDAVPY